MSFNIETITNDFYNKTYYKKSLSLIKSSVDEYGLNIKTLSEKTFYNPTKKSRKWLMSLFNEEKNIGWIHVVRLLCKSLKINQDLVFDMLKNLDLSDTKHSDSLNLKLLNLLKKQYDEKRVTKLILNSDFSHISDIEYMLENISSMRDLSFLPKKPKNLNEIHNSCERMSQKLQTINFSLEQREDILALDNTEINNEMIIRVPKTHYDLIDLGEDLNFCIGNGFYSKEVKSQNCSVVAIYKNKRPIYGVQFNRYAIKQAYGFGNETIPNKILIDIQNALISAPEVPNDFIAIDDSTWINGYKYNDKDLYLLINGHIYVYFDVEKRVYEELIYSERKGTFVNKIIKANYKYEKLS